MAMQSTTPSESDQGLLHGAKGRAMRVVDAVARSMGAPRLVDIVSAHVDGCLYVGKATVDITGALVEGRALAERRIHRPAASGPLARLSGTGQSRAH